MLKLLFDCHCQNFHLGSPNGSTILQPNYFILQPFSPLLLFLSFPRRKSDIEL